MSIDTQKRITLGIIESVGFPGLGVDAVRAKIDTGAYSGALHCESIEEIIHPATGKKALKVVPIDPAHHPVIFEKFATVYATSSSSHRSKRYIVATNILLRNELYEIKIGLTKREMMNVKVLIGRRFIRRNNMLVDVTLNQELDNDGGRKI